MTFSTKILVVVTAVAAGAVVAVVLAFEGADATPGARFSVLNKPAASIPPGSFTADLRNAGADRDQDARLALRRSGLEFYVVSTAQDRLCLAVRSRAATVSTCAARSTLDPTSLIWIGHAKPNGVFDLYGLAPDGIATAEIGSVKASLASNVFYIRDAVGSDHHVVLRGPAGEAIVDIGEVVPSGVTIAPDPE